MIDNAKGFTRAGVERINDSILTYCWAILGSQSQTRTGILGPGIAFDAQKQFLANVEDAINSPVDLPSQIARYQNTLRYARSKVDFVFEIGLYMSPSNMQLRIGTIQDYNNEIVVPPKQTKTVNGTKTKQSHPEQPDQVVSDVKLAHQLENPEKDVKFSMSDTPSQPHEKKTALIIGRYCFNNTSTLQSYLVIHSLAAIYNKPVIATTRAHKIITKPIHYFPSG